MQTERSYLITKALFIPLAVLLAGIATLTFFVPHYLETKLVPQLANTYNLPLSLKIRQISLTKSDLSTIIVGNKDAPVLRIDSIRLDYSLAMLRKRKIHQIVIAGLEINATISDGKLVLPDFIKNLANNPPHKTTQNSQTALPFLFDKILISKAILNITNDKQLIKIPWGMELTPDLKNYKYKAKIKLNKNKQQMQATALFDLKNQLLQLTANIKNNGRKTAFKAANLDLTITKHRDNFSAIGKTDVKIGGPIRKNINIKALDLSFAFSGNYKKTGQWKFELSNSPKIIPLALSNNEISASASSANNPSAFWKLTSIIKKINVHGISNGSVFSLQYGVVFTDTKVNALDTSLQFGALQVHGKTNKQGTRLQTTFTGFGHIKDFNIAEINGDLPMRWPYKPAKPGKVAIKGLHWHNFDLGTTAFVLSQNKNGFNFTGNYDSALLKGLRLAVDGNVDLSGSRTAANFHFKNIRSSFSDLNLSQFTPKLTGYTIDTDIKLNGGGSYRSNLFQANLTAALHNITLQGENGLNLQGGDLALTFPEANLRSKPGRFTFKQLKFGDIAVKDGLLEFQIESPESILLEKSSAKWCNGHIYTQAMRFSPKVDDYNLSLYCDRLNVAQLLEQFGAANASGEGRVTGKIPIKIRGGRLIPQDGFLYSTPGTGGTIKLYNTQRLTAGITPGTPQFAQIDLAREALKNFSYDWTSIDLSGDGDDLLMHLQIDGKPASPLPFVYKKSFGGFVRVNAKNPGSKFQGIKLDVNFRLPLNQILHYGKAIKQLSN